jgi:hypothetical protein
LAGKPAGSFDKIACKWEDNIKMDSSIQGIGLIRFGLGIIGEQL